MSEIFRPYKSFPTQKYFKTLPEKEWFGEPNGVATLDENGKLSPDQIPSGVGDSHNKGWFANPSALPAVGEDGDYAIVGTTDTVWVWDSDTSTWVDSGDKGAVTTVNGKTGEVVLKAVDIAFDATAGIIGDTVQAAITNVNLHTADNNTAIGALKNQVHFINASIPDHTTTIGGILDITDNDSVADIKKNGVSIFTTFVTSTELDKKADKADVANITTEGNVTNISDTLNVGGGISNGNTGIITTGSISAAEELETKTLVLSGTQAVKIDTFDTSVTSASKDTGIPTSKAVYNGLYNIDSAKANKDATNISTPELINAWKEKLEIDVIEASLDTYQTKSNLVTSLSSTSTNTQYPSAKAVYNYAQAKVSSTVEISIVPTVSQTATAITGALAKPARVVVIPNINNIGAVYIKESTEYSSINPIYPDPTNNVYEFTNMSAVNIFVDSIGDSVDLVIEYRG